MADYTVRVVTTRICQVALPNPTNVAEFGKAISYAHDEFKRVCFRSVEYDDDLTIRADDDGICIEFSLPSDNAAS